MDNIDKIESMLGFQYLSTNYSHLLQIEGMLRQKLQKAPQHLQHMAEIKRVQNDMAAIAKLMANIQAQLLNKVEDDNEIQFEYLIKRKSEDGKVNGSSIQIVKD